MSHRPAAAEHRGRSTEVAEIFGDVLPATTADERDDDPRERGASEDRWYLENRPPHYDSE